MCRILDGGLQQVGTLLAHQAAKLTGDCAAGSIFAEYDARDRDHNEQYRTQRRHGVEGDSRAARQGFVVKECTDTFS